MINMHACINSPESLTFSSPIFHFKISEENASESLTETINSFMQQVRIYYA